jgi:hypothetical protein
MPTSPQVLTFDPKTGGATLDLRAAEAHNDREFQAALRDLHRMGMSRDADQHLTTPRATVQAATTAPQPYAVNPQMKLPLPAGAEPYRADIEKALGLSDLPSQVQFPGERYWEQWRNPRLPSGYVRGQVAGRSGGGGRPQAKPPIYTQPMTWLAPPITAISIDAFTPAAGVSLSGAYPGPGACIDVVSIDVPDRFIVVLDRFGNELEDHDAFGDVRFSMMRNETPIRSYGNFDVQLGRFDDPTRFGSPIILKHKDAFRLKCQALGAVDHIAYARFIGWAFAVRATNGDGSHEQYIV